MSIFCLKFPDDASIHNVRKSDEWIAVYLMESI